MIRHGWLICSRSLVLFYGVVALTGCAAKPGWTNYPVAVYADSTVTSSPAKTQDLTDAIAFWEQQAGKKLFDYKGEWTGGAPYSGDPGNISAIQANVVMFQNPWPFNSDYAGQTTTLTTNTQINNAVVMINPNVEFCSADCADSTSPNPTPTKAAPTTTTPTSERKTFTHELGHFLGLVHVQDTTNIMYPTIQPGGTLDNVTIDKVAFEALL